MKISYRELKELGMDLDQFCEEKNMKIEDIIKTNLNEIELNTDQFKRIIKEFKTKTS